MNAVAIASGGLDSTVLLWKLRNDGHVVKALGFDYGQRHRVELKALRAICERGQFPLQVVDLSSLGSVIAGDSSQLNPEVEVPEGHYADETMKQTVVPNRNMIMLSVAIGHAVATGAEAVAYGAHAGDHAIYPDCREPFAAAMGDAARLCDWNPVELLRPFVRMSKAEIVAEGSRLHAPLEVTWSCYKGGDVHCGRCGTCVERREAFEQAGVQDPTEYLA